VSPECVEAAGFLNEKIRKSQKPKSIFGIDFCDFQKNHVRFFAAAFPIFEENRSGS